MGTGGQQCALQLVAEATRGEALSTRLGDNDPDTAWRPEQIPTLDWAPHDTTNLNPLLLRTVLHHTGLSAGNKHSESG
jgi:hypothetical protein